MKVIAFNFIKISVERNINHVEGLKINSNIDVSEIEELKIDSIHSTENSLVNVKFSFLLDYHPDFAKLELKGNVVLELEEKRAKEILHQWKEKSLDDDFNIPVLNLILKKSTVKALELEDEMGLPFHIQLPSLAKENKGEK